MAMGGTIFAKARVKESSISAVITRADGSVEELGTIAYWHRNPLRRWAWGARKFLGDLRRAAREGWKLGKNLLARRDEDGEERKS